MQQCDHCGICHALLRCVLMRGRELQLCMSCAALARLNVSRMDQRGDDTRAAAEQAMKDARALLAPLDALVRKRKPAGSARWWR